MKDLNKIKKLFASKDINGNGIDIISYEPNSEFPIICLVKPNTRNVYYWYVARFNKLGQKFNGTIGVTDLVLLPTKNGVAGESDPLQDPISFPSKADLIKYLMEIGPVYSSTGDKIFYSESAGKSPFRYENLALTSHWNIEGTIFYTKPHWYNRIPEGTYVSCYVSHTQNVPDRACSIDLIKLYILDQENSFVGDRGAWKYATPISKDDIWIPET